ncbi:Aste57867_3918 [Aphanomyces stellatus]|uniref:Aste57867_3918 protein n=1 Tax=Aphanomyces stellatus TaxID=120398 RepID=A0A485KFZ2_9STRA|nr:hypothetical protein As57867_003907 [Aphanomyces stellatus]VFT81057.1 Aste57867_3918 [Aphanomyces stellatus]
MTIDLTLCPKNIGLSGRQSLSNKEIESMPLVPPDVLVRIAHCIGDAGTLFSFLEALGTPEARGGSLESLWQLGLVHERMTLWPMLRLSNGLMESSMAHVEEVISMYSAIQICWADDIDWLISHLRLPTKVEWNVFLPGSFCGPIPDCEWFDKWSHLPITSLKLQVPPNYTIGATLYPWLANLINTMTQLELSGYLNVAAIFSFAAVSTRVTKLEMRCYSHVILTNAVVRDVMQWLESTPVRRFRFHTWLIAQEVEASEYEALCAAMFHSPTLDELSLVRCTCLPLVTSLNPLQPLAMQELTLCDLYLSPQSIASLACVVRHSSLVTLTLASILHIVDNLNDAYEDAFAQLLQAVAQSNIVYLALDYCALGDNMWQQHGVLLGHTNIQNLSLKNNSISNVGGACIALALGENAAIQKVNLEGNNISGQGVRWLLNSNPCCNIPLRELVLIENGKFEDNEKAELKALAKTNGVLTLRLQ